MVATSEGEETKERNWVMFAINVEVRYTHIRVHRHIFSNPVDLAYLFSAPRHFFPMPLFSGHQRFYLFYFASVSLQR
jgi:hypothetical protein